MHHDNIMFGKEGKPIHEKRFPDNDNLIDLDISDDDDDSDGDDSDDDNDR